MSKNPGIDFVQAKPKNIDKVFQRSISIISFNQVESMTLIPARKSSGVKKIKSKAKSQENQNKDTYSVAFSFGLSIRLINLLRNPKFKGHEFEEEYIKQVKEECWLLSSDNSHWQYIIYMHLLLAQVQNLDEMQALSGYEIVKFNEEAWNQTNIMNYQCIIANLSNPKEQTSTPSHSQKKKYHVTCQLVSNEGINVFSNDKIIVSVSYVELAMRSKGHLDIYFGPFLINEFPFQACMWYHQFLDIETALQNYSKIFIQISKESKESNQIDFQKWYNEQVSKILKDDFNIEQLINFLNYNENNEYVEKILIGLLGWNKLTDEAINYLNVYYDNCDWQINSELNSVIRVEGQEFEIDYLIENKIQNRKNLIICLKAPCFNGLFNGEVFSWHSPKLVQYISDDQSYIWIKKNFGNFRKSGFYDWTLFNLADQGKNATNKILNIGSQNKKETSSSGILNKSAITVKSVKGRYIVQPLGINELFLHQINLDALNSDQGVYKAPTFSDANKQIAQAKANGVNCVYLMGVFQRDNEEVFQVYRKPHASSVAITNRTSPCKMLGKPSQFKALVQKAHKEGLKVIVDCTTRISSSRMSKKYDNFRLKNIDEQGKIIYHYGSNGRSINYDDTTVLNYRKKDAWDLLINEIKEIIVRYEIDGIYLDNGFQWPQLFEINREEMMRKEQNEGNYIPVYSNNQIFEGEIVYPNKISGYWTSKLSYRYPNPFLTKLCKHLWREYPNLIIIAEGLEIEDQSNRIVSIIKSGPIPRMYKIPKALAQIVGLNLKNNGETSQIVPKNINHLKTWYEDMIKWLPKNAITIQSTTSPVWPYLSYILKKAVWPVIDLYLFLPHLTMTSGLEEFGRAYKTKSMNINYMVYEKDRQQAESIEFQHEKKKFFKKNSSNFFSQEEFKKIKKGNIVNCVNLTIKDPSQIKYSQQNFRKEVGPEFGFDVYQLHKHFQHRRQLRKSYKVLQEGQILSVTAEHLYGIHNNILSFVRYDESEMLLISINFNNSTIDMHYNLTPLKKLFKKYERNSIVVKIEDVLNKNKFIEEYYLVNELISSKIQAKIEPYKTIIWKLTIIKSEDKLKEALACSSNRMKEKLSRTPPGWIYSSVFFNQLDFLLQKVKSKYQIVQGLNQIYNRLIVPYDLNLSLVINKNYEFYTHKHKLQKLFGIFKLISDQPQVQPLLKTHIKNMLSKNTLGPIAFVTPQIGSWSSVGGLGVMVDELSKELVKLGEQVYIITPYYEYNKKKQTNYLIKDGFSYERNIKLNAAHLQYQFGIHRGKYSGVNYIWFHNPELFSRPYDGEGALYVTKQLIFFALITLESFCQLKIFPSIIITNDWMCGFVSAYVKCKKYKQVFDGSKFMHICHNLDPLYQGRLYPKVEEGNFNWLIQLPSEWYTQTRNNKLIVNPSKCALETCDNWGTVSHSYKIDLLQESPLANILWKFPHPFSFPNGIRKDERLSILQTKTPGTHDKSKKILQEKYFKCQDLKDNIPLFAFIGRITKQKGVHLILDAVQSLLHEYNFNIQFLVGGMADSKEEYGKYCADKMKILTNKYPLCFWSSPDQFFNDGPLVNIGSDFSLMPSLFEPGGIVQHEFFCGGTPVIAFKTGGLKDTVFQFDPKTLKGNGFNFMSYDLQDFKKCMRRGLDCYKNRSAYEKLRQNAFQSVVQQEDVARGWNNEFYRLQDKIYIDWIKVEQQVKKFDIKEDQKELPEISIFQYEKADYWRKDWIHIEQFKEVLKNASRLKGKSHQFCFQTKKIPRPKEVFICGTWDQWAKQTKLIFDKIKKNYKISLKLQPGSYQYKYIVQNEWLLTEQQEKQIDENGIINHIVKIE